MARLPKPGGDNNTWGTVLNEFLGVEHNGDGTLKASGSLKDKADDASVVHLTGAEIITGAKTFSAPPVIPVPTTASHALNKGYADDQFINKAGGVMAGDLAMAGHVITDVSSIRT